MVIGLGNPIVSDDGVGIHVARLLRQRIGCRDGVEIREAYSGGIRLMDILTGFDGAIIVDAVAPEGAPGAVSLMSVTDLISSRNTVSSHDTDLATALEAGRLLGVPLPSRISILGIEAKDVSTFGEELSAEVAGAVPAAVEWILGELDGGRS